MRLAVRVATVAEELLARKKYVAPIDVLAGLGWLSGRVVESWEQGRTDQLDQVAAVSADRLAEAVAILAQWARDKGLTESAVDYVAATRDRRSLRFTSGDDKLYRTHWTDPSLPPARREKVLAKQQKVPDLVVIQQDKHWYCTLCRDTGDFHFLENDLPVCVDCADMGHLVFLPSGDTALTRRAHKASGLAAIVVKWNKSRKRFQRCGLLVEHAALEAAEEQCFADEELRERRKARDRERRAAQDVEFQAAFAARIVALFPRLAADRAQAIAEHAGTRSSGRVGRSAAGRALDEGAVTLAVVAAIRHEETGYDAMLMAGVPRAEARERIRDDIERVLAEWRSA
ncbi:DUF2293 domain-containing protein [Actinokineospora sp. HUAS TT18]|uniref:DUF2293 domain-containing protein n=1 Tax=Actinokineospora sp. HUAS TT18 TaxID=3447451 RepID=UPI003F522170